MPRFLPALLACLAAAATARAQAPAPPQPAAAAWTPAAWSAEDTVELTTDVAGEGLHTFPVWLVVLDGQLYVRLGGRAAARVEQSREAPFVGVTVAGRRFERVRAEPVPDMAERVADAMAEKYWSDVFIRFVPHPLTARLVPQ